MADKLKPLYYAKDMTVFKRAVQVSKSSVRMGFAVCEVRDGVNPEDVAALLNKADPPSPDEPKGRGE